MYTLLHFHTHSANADSIKMSLLVIMCFICLSLYVYFILNKITFAHIPWPFKLGPRRTDSDIPSSSAVRSLCTLPTWLHRFAAQCWKLCEVGASKFQVFFFCFSIFDFSYFCFLCIFVFVSFVEARKMSKLFVNL